MNTPPNQLHLSDLQINRNRYSNLIDAVKELDANVVGAYFDLIDYIGGLFIDLNGREPNDQYKTLTSQVTRITEFLAANSTTLESEYKNTSQNILNLVQNKLHQDIETIIFLSNFIDSNVNGDLNTEI
jgi:hypothetical protein